MPLARSAIARELGQTSPPHEDAAWLHEPGASFVTLMLDDELRGCIGTLEAHRSLLDDVKVNAKAAAFSDPRFMPLEVDELHSTEIEISLLSAMQPMQFASEADALAQLRPGVDGVFFEYLHFRSTFLPQVWEQLPNTVDFMGHLKRKCGLPANFWANGVRLYRYSVSKFKERDLLSTSAHAGAMQ